VAVGAPSILAAQKATKTIPIVFVPPQDPITLKLTTSLARPDSNLTGFTTMRVDVAPKRVQLLKSAFLELNSVSMLFDPWLLTTSSGTSKRPDQPQTTLA
jgi:putative tryptophan/tyrosine transport system substrate-binding protein